MKKKHTYFDSSNAGGSHVGALTLIPRFTLRCVPQTTHVFYTHTNHCAEQRFHIRRYTWWTMLVLIIFLSSYRQRKKTRLDSVTSASFYFTSKKFYLVGGTTTIIFPIVAIQTCKTLNKICAIALPPPLCERNVKGE